MKKIMEFLKHYKRPVAFDLVIPSTRGVKKESDLYNKSYDRDEIDKLCDRATCPMEVLIIRLSFEGGLRASEVAGIKINNIDFDKDEITTLGKRSKVRRVHFSKKSKFELLNYLHGLPKEQMYLFEKSGGVPYNRKDVYYRVNKVGIRSFGDTRKNHPHMLRHSLGRYLREKKTDIVDIRDYLDHSDISSTQIYTQVDKSIVKEKVKGLLNE